jgi:hypothetical protein
MEREKKLTASPSILDEINIFQAATVELVRRYALTSSTRLPVTFSFTPNTHEFQPLYRSSHDPLSMIIVLPNLLDIELERHSLSVHLKCEITIRKDPYNVLPVLIPSTKNSHLS